MKRVVCAISGGVDSAIAAVLLKRKGYSVIGCFVKCWDEKDETGCCTYEKDLEDAKFVCRTLNIDLHFVDLVKHYWNNVFHQFLCDYANGLTPNPDVLCNKYIKFGVLIDYIKKNLNTNLLATGHYAKILPSNDCFNKVESLHLFKARDYLKDQTFFLSQISQESLRHVLFPLSDLLKSEVKSIAFENGLDRIAKKRESTGICFIGKRNFKSFVKQYIADNPGSIVDVDTQKEIGEHDGIHAFTIGQRVAVPFCTGPYYVSHKDPSNNILYVAKGSCHPSLYVTSFETESAHWIIGHPPELLKEKGEMSVMFKFQHRHKEVFCTCKLRADGSLMIELPFPFRGIALGQYASFYDGEECLGSARITRRGQCMLPSAKNFINSDKLLVKERSFDNSYISCMTKK